MTLPTLEQLEQDPYAALGVRKFINATCHHTIMGGTLIPDTTLKAMRIAANDFVDLKELQKAAGKVISEITHADDGYIVSGCAAGLMVSAAAIITGTDEALIEQLPYVQGGQVPCVAKRFARAKNYKGDEYVNHGYAMAVKTAGVKFVEIGEPDPDGRPTKVVSAEEYDQAFVDNPDAKMVYWVGYAPPEDIALEDVIDIAHAHGARVIIDASNCLPPRENLYRFIDIGADVVCFSGGKGIQGPQGSGIIAGDQDLIDAIAMQSAPHTASAESPKSPKKKSSDRSHPSSGGRTKTTRNASPSTTARPPCSTPASPTSPWSPTPTSSSPTKTIDPCPTSTSKSTPPPAKTPSGSSTNSATATPQSPPRATQPIPKS